MSYSTSDLPSSRNQYHNGPGGSTPEVDQAAVTGSTSAPENATAEQDELSEPQTAWQSIRSFYERNFGLFLVFLAEIFASLVRKIPPP